MDMVEVDGLTSPIERVGYGPPLVLAHGYVGDGPTTWRRQLDGLSDALHRRGVGRTGGRYSSDPPEGFGLDGYADCLAGFIEARASGRPNVAGLLFGGIVALGAAPAGIRAWHALDPRPPRTRAGRARCPPTPRTSASAKRWRWPTSRPRRSSETLLPTMFSRATTSPRAVQDFRAAWGRSIRPAFGRWREASTEDVRDVLPRLDVPTLLLYGDRDVRAPLTVA